MTDHITVSSNPVTRGNVNSMFGQLRNLGRVNTPLSGFAISEVESMAETLTELQIDAVVHPALFEVIMGGYRTFAGNLHP